MSWFLQFLWRADRQACRIFWRSPALRPVVMRKSRCYGGLTCSLLGFYENEAAVICDHTMVNMTSMSLGVQAPIEILYPMQKYIIFSRQDKCKTPYLHLFAAFWPRMCLPLSSHQRLGYFQNCKGFRLSLTKKQTITEKLWETNISCRQEPLSFKQRDIEDKDINKASTLLGILCEKSAEGGYQRNELEINQYSSKYSSKDIFIIYLI